MPLAAAPERLAIEQVSVRAFRNLAAVDLAFGPRFNVVAGDNGQGKTNLLEALYVLCTSRSFRASRPGDLVAHGGDLASVRGVLREGGGTREQSVGLKAGARLVRVDGKRPPTLAAYAVKSPVIVFHPGEIALSMGGGSERRRLLDRVALYLDASSMAEQESYTRALRERQKALETRGPSAQDLDEWEELVVRHGLRVMAGRRAAAERLGATAVASFARIAAPDLVLRAAYAPGAPEDAEAFRAALSSRRPEDARRGNASIGPHRDDLRLAIGAHGVRGVASQGQHRAVVLALKSAEVEVVGAARGVRPLLLLDDVSSELDRARTAALFAFLRDHEGQVFLTTTRPELIETGGLKGPQERRDFSVVSGSIRPPAEAAGGGS
jgi:DNA replication and repair protein RecF